MSSCMSSLNTPPAPSEKHTLCRQEVTGCAVSALKLDIKVTEVGRYICQKCNSSFSLLFFAGSLMHCCGADQIVSSQFVITFECIFSQTGTQNFLVDYAVIYQIKGGKFFKLCTIPSLSPCHGWSSMLIHPWQVR